MDGFGKRLRARAQELGLSDIEVARRLGMSQGRFSNYVNDVREPDLATLSKICQALAITPDYAMGFVEAPSTDDQSARLRQRIEAATATMDAETLETAVRVIEALITPSS